MARARAGGHGGYCSVCQRHYRGLYGVHASTETHKAKAYRSHNRHGSGAVGKKHAGQRSAALLHSRQEHADASMVNVHEHQRGLPTPPWPASFREKWVHVIHYWRRPPYIASRVYVPSHKRRRPARRAG